MQGRVFTVMMSVSMGISPIGLAVAGPLADRFGVQLWYLMGAGICLVMGLVVFSNRAIMKLEDQGKEMTASVPAG